MLGVVLLVIVVLALVGTVPVWPHAQGYGWGPSSGIGIVVLILVVLLLAGRI